MALPQPAHFGANTARRPPHVRTPRRHPIASSWLSLLWRMCGNFFDYRGFRSGSTQRWRPRQGLAADSEGRSRSPQSRTSRLASAARCSRGPLCKICLWPKVKGVIVSCRRQWRRLPPHARCNAWRSRIKPAAAAARSGAASTEAHRRCAWCATPRAAAYTLEIAHEPQTPPTGGMAHAFGRTTASIFLPR